ncbi:MAG TPA: cytochrome c oxidase subunit 3, partial [Chloroflexota bacterium]|nr:cytochrome c oxidase subunit 3 [Chloroflexota bacterium]
GEGMNLGVNLFGASFFTLTGFHGAHVTVGVILLLITALRGWRQGFIKQFPLAVEMIGLYWHFVDLVWVVIFTLVYLLR